MVYQHSVSSAGENGHYAELEKKNVKKIIREAEANVIIMALREWYAMFL